MIGDTLREARERQNLSIKDIEKGTSIRALYIESIEKGEFDKLPGNAYTKGFIRSYANFLKLDADACVRQYNEENNPEEVAAKEAAKRAEEAAEAQQQAAYEKREAEKSRGRSGIFGSSRRSESTEPERAAAPRQEAPRVSISDFESRVESSHHRQTLIMGIIAVLVIAAGAYFLFGSDDETASKQPQTKVTTQAKKPAPEPAQQQQAAAKPAEEKKQYTDVQVSAKFSERCWVSVEADGMTIFEGTIDEGTAKDWKAEKELKITAGNAAAVTLTYNGEDKGVLGGETLRAGDFKIREARLEQTGEQQVLTIFFQPFRVRGCRVELCYEVRLLQYDAFARARLIFKCNKEKSDRALLESIDFAPFVLPEGSSGWALPKQASSLIGGTPLSLGQPFFIDHCFFGSEFPAAYNTIQNGVA